MIREALDKAEAFGATALQTNATKGQQSLIALSLEKPNNDATRALRRHTFYLTSVLGTREKIELSEVRRLMGYRTERPVTRREELMSQASWPEETLTIEKLEARFASPASGGGEA